MFALLEWLAFMVLACDSEYRSHRGVGLDRLDALVNNCEAAALIDLESTSSQSTHESYTAQTRSDELKGWIIIKRLG